MSLSLLKHVDFFNPITDVNGRINIIGCGAIGSNVIMQLVKLGIKELHIYDFDTVVPYNLTNQQYRQIDIGKLKVNAIEHQALEINPDIEIYKYKKGWQGEHLEGYIFLCLDNIDLRRKIVEQHFNKQAVLAIFDFRMGLEDAQHYGAIWSIQEHKDKLLASMQFSHEEAKEAQPISACGTTLSVLPTILTITALGVSNFINLIRYPTRFKTICLVNPFESYLEAY